jgi:hypothetical protein
LATGVGRTFSAGTFSCWLITHADAQLKHGNLGDFVQCYRPGNLAAREETERL